MCVPRHVRRLGSDAGEWSRRAPVLKGPCALGVASGRRGRGYATEQFSGGRRGGIAVRVN